jgi:signal transduction histidine kinase
MKDNSIMANPIVQQAQTQITDLIDLLRKGTITPVQLARQLEEIKTAIGQIDDGAAQAPAASASIPANVQEVMEDNAEFLKIAVHELRIPMTSIRGYADMLNNPSMGALSDMQNQMLQVIRANSKRMESLLTDMSIVNKLRAGMLHPNNKMDTFKNIALMADKKARPVADELKRELVFNIPDGLPLLNTDGENLSLALFKLIENGLRYSPENTGRVVISARGEGSRLSVEIEDNGIGMTPEELAQLGTLYFRSDSEVVRAHKGSGLGIPIVYGIIAMLEGTIDVESAPDQGTRFTITLKGLT